MDTKLKWPDPLPTALVSMRVFVNHRTGLSPHVARLGQPMSSPVNPPVPFELCNSALNDDTVFDYCVLYSFNAYC